MDFMTATRTGLNKLTDWQGKAGVSEFWWYALAVFLGLLVANILFASLLGYLGSLLAWLAWLALMFSATMRRMNDTGKPIVVAYAYFAVASLTIVAPLAGLGALAGILGLASLILLGVMIYFLIQPSAGAAA